MAPCSDRQAEHKNSFLVFVPLLPVLVSSGAEEEERQSLSPATSTPSSRAEEIRTEYLHSPPSATNWEQRTRMSSCLGRAAVPVKRVWRGLSARLGRRRRRATGKLSTYEPVSPERDDRYDGTAGVLVGLGRLRKEVRTCEYRDVHVMWEMLGGAGVDSCRDAVASGDDVDAGKGAPAKTRRTRRTPAPWGRMVAYCCAF